MVQFRSIIGSLFIFLFFLGCNGNKGLIKSNPAKECAFTKKYIAKNSQDINFKNNLALSTLAQKYLFRKFSFSEKLNSFRMLRCLLIRDNSKENKILLSKAAFLIADASVEDKQKLEFANFGASLLEEVVVDEENYQAAYYYAANLGLVLQVRGLFALSKLPLVVKYLKISLNEKSIDDGGPLRALGLIYLKAPAWPKGIGDLDKSLKLLKEGAETYSDLPESHIFYAEALIEDEEFEDAMSHLNIADKLLENNNFGNFYNTRWKNEIIKFKQMIKEKQ